MWDPLVVLAWHGLLSSRPQPFPPFLLPFDPLSKCSNKKYWGGEDADRFIPERFLDDKDAEYITEGPAGAKEGGANGSDNGAKAGSGIRVRSSPSPISCWDFLAWIIY